MTKTKSKNIIILLVLALLTFSTTSFAAVYDWIGSSDVDWENPDNWDVTGSIWTWPNEQYFNIAKERVNDDCEEINIASGNKLSRLYGLTMSGASEGSNETILTISNNTDLYIWGHMWIGQCGNGTVKTEVNNGSSLNIHDSLIVGDAEGSTGLLDVVNGAVVVVGEMYVGKYDNSTGKLQIRRDVPGDGYDLTVWKNMTVGSFNDSVGTVEIKSSTVDIWDNLFVGKQSTGMCEIEDSILDIGGRMEAASEDNSSGTVKIKSSTVGIGDTLFVGRRSTGMFEIEDSILNIEQDLVVGRNKGSKGTVEIKDSTVDIGQALTVGRQSIGMFEIEDSILDIGGCIETGSKVNSSGTVEIKSSTVDIGETLFVGVESTGMCEIEDSALYIDWNLVVGKSSGSTGTVEIKDSTLDIKGRLRLTRGGTSGIMSIEGNSKIRVNEEFQMGDKDTLDAVSKLEMDGGDVKIGSHSHLNMDGGADSVANFTLNDGRWTNGGNIYVGETPRGDCKLTINGGSMASYSNIFVGSPGINDFGQSRIFLNGGLLQGEGLEFNPAESRIVYRGGELWINKLSVTEADMQNLINIGKIDALVNYEITTIGDYTVLREDDDD